MGGNKQNNNAITKGIRWVCTLVFRPALSPSTLKRHKHRQERFYILASGDSNVSGCNLGVGIPPLLVSQRSYRKCNISVPAKRKSAENDLLPFFLVEVFCFPISGGKCQGSQYMHVPSPYEQGERCALSLPFPISFFSQRGYFVIIVIGFPSVSARSLLLRAPLQILHFSGGSSHQPAAP